MASQQDEDDMIALVGLCVVLNSKKKKKFKRKMWSKKWLTKRNEYTHTRLLKDLGGEPSDFRNYLRMDEDAYEQLLLLVTPLIEKKDTVMRKSISPHERLTATLRFLATGRSYECLKYSTLISPQALGKIIPETCEAIYKVLKIVYLQFPNTTEKWKVIAEQFEEKWNFPHCLGAMDGKHIDIVPPADSGSYYYNYKGRHSMVIDLSGTYFLNLAPIFFL
ncbi:uncharacterized protein LOC124361127 [Homalodisca vitripennis]|uniref:uncharacterized protein LOC124361127 n=1 Tax=Homalodisca vitripennis TaxID=197043 RepID=UPI001EEBE051|nr:uncharacterized protein LOC124361127 [Homalodisca vitripennis]